MGPWGVQNCLDENGLGLPWELWLLTHEREKEALRIRTTLEFWEEEVSSTSESYPRSDIPENIRECETE